MDIKNSVKRMADMTAKVIISDLKTDGALPIQCELSLDYKGEDELLKLKFEDIDMEVWIPLHILGMVLGDDEHG